MPFRLRPRPSAAPTADDAGAGRRAWNRPGRIDRTRTAAVVAVTGIAATLTGCAPTVDVAPAAQSNDPRCAPVMIALPHELAGKTRRTTTSQATAAWGDPSAAVLRCGVRPPGPTTERCVSVNGVDWIAVQEKNDTWRLTTYGREPAVELLLDTSRAASSTVLVELAGPVSALPRTRQCLDVRDVPLPSTG
ncbi:hypothetical protein GCM10011512_22370 [Tersicoccus solisilvae]|uniref:DUF3515 domain-containing protein n=1 Tax=Tersicoccus solisilvae TaxID=1882339 RepID=A0ABQ1PD39_9MICC|nr:DUF3515 domain-containing protein [Tersicoccus solisilvae]GGC94872.1 hypothetical protein GCM10011512_22370 [Tersicoccus solisilvae]